MIAEPMTYYAGKMIPKSQYEAIKAGKTPTPAIPRQLADCRMIRVAPKEKRAIDPGWQASANYTPDDPHVLDHLANGGNYGVMPAGGVCILDADDLTGLGRLGVIEPLLPTYTIRTGRESGGAHIYLRCPDAPADKIILRDPTTGADLGDFRGSGHPSYVVGPGSLHPSGRRYEAVDPNAEIKSIAWPALKEVLDRASKTEPAETSTPPPQSPRAPAPKSPSSESISERLGLRVTDFLMPTGATHRDGEIEGAHPIHGSETGNNLTISADNRWWCRRHQTGGGPLEALAVAEGIIDCADVRPGGLQGHWPEVFEVLRRRGYGDQLAEMEREHHPTPAAEERRSGDVENPRYDDLISMTEKGGVRLDHQAIADAIIARFCPITFNKEVWICVDGLYRRESGEILGFVAEVARATGFTGSLTSAVREITAYVAGHHLESTYPFDSYPNALPMANGVLEIDWMCERATLRPYSPDHRFTQRWPAAYDAEADPAPLIGVLREYVDDEEVAALLQLPAQAILHFCGFGPFKRSYIFEGPGNGGKSTYLVDLLDRIFGAGNISGASLQAIGKDRFVTSAIGSAVINRCDDLSDVPLENVGPFKALTGGFSHDIERKFQTAYRGRVTAVHAFSTNAPPTVPDTVLYDAAFWNRWIYLRFNNIFDTDPSFVPRVFTAAATSGLFNKILEVAFSIRKSGRLIFEQDPGEVRAIWQSASNPFQKFLDEEMQSTKEPQLFDKGQLFRAFLTWCGEHDISPRKVPSAITGFTQMIYGAGFVTTRKGPKGAQDWKYEGRYAWKEESRYKEVI